MTRVNEGPHSFIRHTHVHPRMELVFLPLLPSRRASSHFGWYLSFSVPLKVGGWVGLSGWLHTKVICPP